MLGFNLFITLYGIYQKNIFNNDYYVKYTGNGVYECYMQAPTFPRNTDGSLTKTAVLQGSFTITSLSSPKSIMLLNDSRGYFTCIINETVKRYSKDFGRTWTT